MALLVPPLATTMWATSYCTNPTYPSKCWATWKLRRRHDDTYGWKLMASLRPITCCDECDDIRPSSLCRLWTGSWFCKYHKEKLIWCIQTDFSKKVKNGYLGYLLFETFWWNANRSAQLLKQQQVVLTKWSRSPRKLFEYANVRWKCVYLHNFSDFIKVVKVFNSPRND